jgi:hypothetical protein
VNETHHPRKRPHRNHNKQRGHVFGGRGNEKTCRPAKAKARGARIKIKITEKARGARMKITARPGRLVAQS